MVNTTISSYHKAKIGDSLLFPSKNKSPGFIPYHDNVESYTLCIPDNEDHVDDNDIPL